MFDVEYLNLYDMDGNLVRERGIRGKKTDKLKGISIIYIENSSNQFLIQKTSELRNGDYSTTGGHVKYGSNFIETIIMEVKEELGIDISNENIKEITSYIDGYYYVKVFYLKKDINVEDLDILKEEVDSIKWLDIETINELIENKKFREGNIEGYKYVLKYRDNL